MHILRCFCLNRPLLSASGAMLISWSPNAAFGFCSRELFRMTFATVRSVSISYFCSYPFYNADSSFTLNIKVLHDACQWVRRQSFLASKYKRPRVVLLVCRFMLKFSQGLNVISLCLIKKRGRACSLCRPHFRPVLQPKGWENGY